MNAASEFREEGPSLVYLSVFSFVSLGVLGAIVPFLGAQLAERGLRPEQIGWLMAMIPLGRILGAPLWGQLADRYRAAGLLVRVGTLLSLVGALLLWGVCSSLLLQAVYRSRYTLKK